MGLAVDAFTHACSDFYKLKDFLKIMGILFVLNLLTLLPIVDVISYILSYYLTMFWLMPMVLKHYGVKTRYGAITVDSFVSWVKTALVSIAVSCFNWNDKRILYSQIGCLVLTGIAMFVIPWLAFIPLLAFFVLSVYGGIRYMMIMPVRLVDVSGAKDAAARIWHMTEGKFWSILAFLILLNIPFVILVVILSRVLELFAFSSSGSMFLITAPVMVLAAFASVYQEFGYANYYMLLKKEVGVGKAVKAAKK